jgi:AraC family transcriptional regulator
VPTFQKSRKVGQPQLFVVSATIKAGPAPQPRNPRGIVSSYAREIVIAKVAMDKNAAPQPVKIPQGSVEAPVTTFIQLDGKSRVPSRFHIPRTFTITRLQSPSGLPERITKISPVPALLVSISLKPLPSSSYEVWVSGKLIPTSVVQRFRSNIIDFASQPMCWAGRAFDYVHYSVPRQGLDDIAEDLGFGRVSDYRLAVLEDDLVVAQITKSILPFLGRKDALSVLALDQFSLVLGAHLIQRYGVLEKAGRHSTGGLAPWQKRRASEILRENLHGCIRLSDVARECGLSTSHFARSFKTSFGISTHRWLIQHRIERAKELIIQTNMSLLEVAVQSGFNNQPAFTRTFQQFVGTSPGRWRRHYATRRPEA